MRVTQWTQFYMNLWILPRYRVGGLLRSDMSGLWVDPSQDELTSVGWAARLNEGPTNDVDADSALKLLRGRLQNPEDALCLN